MSLPDLQELRAAQAIVAPHIIRTPYVPCYGERITASVPGIDLQLKLELFQRTGSFKPRGAVNVLSTLDKQALSRGVAAFSAGNHAIATAYAASVAGTSAKVVMPSSANAYRVASCKRYGAEVVLSDDIAAAFKEVERLSEQEGRTVIHPFEGPATTAGNASLALEILDIDKDVQDIVVPVGGGGLISGIAAAVKLMLPGCRVIGVEPEGACGMTKSLAQGSPLAEVTVNTIADSLGAPLHLPYSFDVIQQCVDDVVVVSDADIAAMMQLMFEDLKLAVEPAGAAALTAITGPLKDQLAGRRVVAIVCGSNIDAQSWQSLTALN